MSSDAEKLIDPLRYLERRAFLRLLAGASGAVLLPSWAQTRPEGNRRVVVVGAGLAGLTAAYELQRHGHRVTLLEALPRLGGRIYTLRAPFDEGLYAELGGEWIHPEHHYIHHYVRAFELQLDPDDGETAWLDATGLKSLAEAFRSTPGFAEVREQVDARLKDINVFQRPDQCPLAELDQMSYLELLQSLRGTRAAIAIERSLVRTLMTVDLEEISALHMLYEYGLPQPETTESRVRGGNSLLVAGFAKPLGENVKLGAVVHMLRWDSRGIRVHYRYRAEEQQEDADDVIIAVPGAQVRRLRFDPALPDEVAAAYAALGLGRNMKVVLQSRRRFWKRPESPYEDAYTNREASHVYESSHAEKGLRGLLTCYSGGRGVEGWGRLESAQRVSAARGLVGKVWHAARTEIERGAAWHWDAQRYFGGSYAFFGPGQMTRVRPVLSQRVDRIHFAGEHTAVWQGYMNGAVESGLRAATEIEPAVRRLYDELTQRARAPKRSVRVAA